MTPEAMRELCAKCCDERAKDTPGKLPTPREYKDEAMLCAAAIRAIPIPPAAAQDAPKLSGLRGMVKTDKSPESIIENSHKQWNDQSAAQEADKPVAWWNGISERNSDFNTVPSWALKEDTNHDIPIYAGYNPESEYANKLAAANARADEAERKVRVLDAEFDDLTQRHNAYKERYTDGQERMPE